MALKVFRPTSPGRRAMSGYTFDEITKDKPEKSLLVSKKNRAGRNNRGIITVRHQGGGENALSVMLISNEIKLVSPAKSKQSSTTRTVRHASLLYFMPMVKNVISWRPSV